MDIIQQILKIITSTAKSRFAEVLAKLREESISAMVEKIKDLFWGHFLIGQIGTLCTVSLFSSIVLVTTYLSSGENSTLYSAMLASLGVLFLTGSTLAWVYYLSQKSPSPQKKNDVDLSDIVAAAIGEIKSEFSGTDDLSKLVQRQNNQISKLEKALELVIEQVSLDSEQVKVKHRQRII